MNTYVETARKGQRIVGSSEAFIAGYVIMVLLGSMIALVKFFVPF